MKRISRKEHQERVERALLALDRSRLDCLVVFAGVNFLYFTGLRFARERYRIVVLLIGRDGRLWLLGPAFEEVKLRQCATDAHVQTWTDAEDQHRRIAEILLNTYGSHLRVGVEPTTDHYHLLGLKAAMTEASFWDGSAATDELRAIKSQAEIDCLRDASELTLRRMDQVSVLLSEGMTERELARLYGPSAMIQFGLTTALPNAPAGQARLGKNDIVVIDAGDRVERYRSDIARTFFWNEPTERMKDVYRIVNEAELAAIDAVKPGESAANVDLAARGVIERAGLGRFFLHRGGHGIGLAFHEIPICAEGSRDILQPGMVLTAEPGVYLPGEFGVRLEDDILVTDTGCELLAERRFIYDF